MKRGLIGLGAAAIIGTAAIFGGVAASHADFNGGTSCHTYSYYDSAGDLHVFTKCTITSNTYPTPTPTPSRWPQWNVTFGNAGTWGT